MILAPDQLKETAKISNPPSSILNSSYLREFSHGKDMERIIKDATEVITYIKSKGLEVRFSSEDSFRSDLVDLLNLYKAVDQLGVNRVGIADTVGCANPRQVYDLVKTLRSVLKPTTDIECHFHNGMLPLLSPPSPSHSRFS